MCMDKIAVTNRPKIININTKKSINMEKVASMYMIINKRVTVMITEKVISITMVITTIDMTTITVMSIKALV